MKYITKPITLALAMLAAPSFALACETVTIGDLSIQNLWSRATVGTTRPAVFYVEVTNAGTADDALTGIATPAAGTAMLHETVISDGMASMPHAASVPVPAGETVRLAPGGYHGMLMELTAALTEGDSFPVTLHFETAGEVTVEVPVLSMRAEASPCADAK